MDDTIINGVTSDHFIWGRLLSSHVIDMTMCVTIFAHTHDDETTIAVPRQYDATSYGRIVWTFYYINHDACALCTSLIAQQNRLVPIIIVVF